MEYRALKKWLLEIPSNYPELFELQDRDWELREVTSQGVTSSRTFAVLWVEGTQANTFLGGGEPGYKLVGNRAFATSATVQRKFNITCRDSRSVLFELVGSMAEVVNSSGISTRKHQPVRVIDYVWPEIKDRIRGRQQRQEPYTERFGMIYSPEPAGPAIGYPEYWPDEPLLNQFIKDGFTFVFADQGRYSV